MLAFLDGQSPAAMKGIEEKLLSLTDGFNNEVTGQTNTGDFQARTRADGHRDHGQGNRNPGAALEDLVEIAIAGIIIRLHVAPKTHVMKEIAAQAGQARFQAAGEIALALMRHGRQLAQIGLHVQVGVLVPCQLERYFGEIHRNLGLGSQQV